MDNSQSKKTYFFIESICLSDSKTKGNICLLRDNNKSLAGYYFSIIPDPVILYCAPSGHWLEWKPELQEWQREQEWCKFYYDGQYNLIKIQTPEGFPSPDSVVREEIRKTKEKAKQWKPEPTWRDIAIDRCLAELDPMDVQFFSDGSCEIQDGWYDLDFPLGYVPVRFSWKLDEENTKKLLSLTHLEVDNYEEIDSEEFFEELRILSREESVHFFSDLFTRLGIDFEYEES